MDRARKKELVEELNGVFSEASLVVVTSQSGLTVAESTDLRSRMREADASYKVTKNRLVKLAIVGTPYEGQYPDANLCMVESGFYSYYNKLKVFLL